MTVAVSFQVTGLVTTVSPLTLVKADMQWGKWLQSPAKTIEPGAGTLAFVAGPGKACAGVMGTVCYELPDGAQFALIFDDPYSKGNYCAIEGISGPFDRYTASVEFPAEGTQWEAKYFIRLA